MGGSEEACGVAVSIYSQIEYRNKERAEEHVK